MRSAQEIRALEERAKELSCLYRVAEAVGDREAPPHAVFQRVLEAIPDGWQRPQQTRARIEYLGRSYFSAGFTESKPGMRAPIALFGNQLGFIEVIDTQYAGEDAFLEEEHQLLGTIARRLSEYLEWKQQQLFGEPAGAQREHWGWRQSFAEALARSLKRLGVQSVYLHGSTETGRAGPGSDIDLLVVFRGTEEQRRELRWFLDGYSDCLAEVAHQHTGYKIQGGLLDVVLADVEPRDVSFMRKLALD